MARETTQIKVAVTERDIERAQRSNSYQCVVAQAIARTVRDATRIEVDTQTIRFTRGDRRLVYLTPYAVQGYVIAFDAGDPIEPFSFQLRNPIPKVARRLRTAAGKEVRRATNKAQRTRPLAAPLGAAEATPKEAVTAAYREARAIAGEGPLSRSTGGRRIPRVFKKKSRSYGNRLLRINQQPHDAAV